MAAYNYGNGTAVLGTTYGFVTAVGVGWMANYFQWLSVQSITDSSTTYAVVNAFRPDGRV